MLYECADLLVVAFCICFLFGVVYPAVAILVYPIYRLFGGKMGLREYIRSL